MPGQDKGTPWWQKGEDAEADTAPVFSANISTHAAGGAGALPGTVGITSADDVMPAPPGAAGALPFMPLPMPPMPPSVGSSSMPSCFMRRLSSALSRTSHLGMGSTYCPLAAAGELARACGGQDRTAQESADEGGAGPVPGDGEALTSGQLPSGPHATHSAVHTALQAHWEG